MTESHPVFVITHNREEALRIISNDTLRQDPYRKALERWSADQPRATVSESIGDVTMGGIVQWQDERIELIPPPEPEPLLRKEIDSA